MEIDNKKILIGAGVLVIGYLAYKSMKNKPDSITSVAVSTTDLNPITKQAGVTGGFVGATDLKYSSTINPITKKADVIGGNVGAVLYQKRDSKYYKMDNTGIEKMPEDYIAPTVEITEKQWMDEFMSKVPF